LYVNNKAGAKERKTASFGIVMKLMNGSLAQLLKDTTQRYGTMTFTLPMAEGLEDLVTRCLSAASLAHGDLHAGNILYKLQANGKYKFYLTDWGMQIKPERDSSNKEDARKMLKCLQFLCQMSFAQYEATTDISLVRTAYELADPLAKPVVADLHRQLLHTYSEVYKRHNRGVMRAGISMHSLLIVTNITSIFPMVSGRFIQD